MLQGGYTSSKDHFGILELCIHEKICTDLRITVDFPPCGRFILKSRKAVGAVKINEVEDFCPVCTRAIQRITDFYTAK